MGITSGFRSRDLDDQNGSGCALDDAAGAVLVVGHELGEEAQVFHIFGFGFGFAHPVVCHSFVSVVVITSLLSPGEYRASVFFLSTYLRAG